MPATTSVPTLVGSAALDGDALIAPPVTVDGAAAAADLDRAVALFAQAYAGEFRPHPSRVSALRRSLKRGQHWSPKQLARLLADLFRARDGHLAFDFGGAQPARAVRDNPIDQGLAPWLPDGPGAAPRTAPRTWQATGTRKAGEVAAVELSPGVVPVLAIRTFDNSAEGMLRDLPGLARRLRRHPAFVVDLRGNAGGNVAFAEAFVLELTDQPLRLLDETEVVGKVALEGRINTARYDIARGWVGEDARPHYETHLALLAQGLHRSEGRPGRTEVVHNERTVAGTASRAYEGRAVFLVDGGCASACEMMVSLVRQLPNAIVAGRATRGAMGIGELATFRLPRSGVVVRFGTRKYDDARGGYEETRGYLPEVEIEGESALLEAMRLAYVGPR